MNKLTLTTAQKLWILIGIVVPVVWVYNLLLVRQVFEQGGTATDLSSGASIALGSTERPAPAGIYRASDRDPFLPAREALKSESPPVKLKGVIWDTKRPLAVIEDGSGMTYIVKAKDKIGDDVLVTIKPDRITMRKKNGKTYELALGP